MKTDKQDAGFIYVCLSVFQAVDACDPLSPFAPSALAFFPPSCTFVSFLPQKPSLSNLSFSPVFSLMLSPGFQPPSFLLFLHQTFISTTVVSTDALTLDRRKWGWGGGVKQHLLRVSSVSNHHHISSLTSSLYFNNYLQVLYNTAPNCLLHLATLIHSLPFLHILFSDHPLS